MASATLMFSVPWSPRTRLSQPWVWTASMKRTRTVSDRLLLLTRIPVTSRDLPSIKQCVTILNFINPTMHQYNDIVWGAMPADRVDHHGATKNLPLPHYRSSCGWFNLQIYQGFPGHANKRQPDDHEGHDDQHPSADQ